MYALDNGNRAEILDGYEKDFRKLSTEIREEIVLARKFNNLY